MNVYYHLVDLWPLLVLLGGIWVVNGIRSLAQKPKA